MSTCTFEWDDNKDAYNQLKHQVSFHAAQAAFADPHSVTARDLAHRGVGKAVLLYRQGGRWNFDGAFYLPENRDSRDQSRILAQRKGYF